MAWKFYAWTLLVLTVATLIGRIVLFFRVPGSVEPWDILEACLSCGLLLSLFGYVYHHAYIGLLFWQIAIPLAGVALLYSLQSPTHRKLAAKKGFRTAFLATAASFVLGLPGMIAAVRYAFFSPSIWQ